MAKTIVLTIVSNNYMAYAATLLSSVRDTNPDYDRYVFLADKIDSRAQLWPGLFKTIEAESLGIPSFADMILRYDIMEFNTAIKPFAIKWVFNNTDADRVIYLDPDIRVYRKLDELDTLLDGGCSIVLTPHITEPLEDERLPNDHSMLQAGVFNLGFIAVKRTDEAISYVDWWARRLTTQCYSDVPNNLFTDQRWCDLAPCFIDNLKILKNPGYNVAYWNLAQRPITVGPDQEIRVSGGPLAFFHFSGLGLHDPTMVSKHQNRFNWNNIGSARDLFIKYRKELTSNRWQDVSRIDYTYGMCDDFEITSIVRRLYKSKFPSAYVNAELNKDFLVSLCNGPDNQSVPVENVRITELMRILYEARTDLKDIFDLNVEAGVRSYAAWFEQSAKREYQLHDCVVFQHMILATPAPKVAIPKSVPNADRSFMYRKWRRFRRMLLNALDA